MRDKEIVISALLILISFDCIQSIHGDLFEECDGVADDEFVANTKDCRSYIYCQGEDSMSAFCDEGEYFDAKQLGCYPKEQVYCPLDDNDDDGELSPELEEPEVSEEMPTTMRIRTTTPTSVTTTTSIDSSLSSLESLSQVSQVKDNCPITDDPNQIILMANSQSCSDYYLCYHGHPMEMHCTNHLHFNIYTGKCDFPENAQCLKDRPNIAHKCLPHVTDFFPHPENCNYFYYCIKGYMTVQQCPFHYGWDIERRACVVISEAKCYGTTKQSI